MSDSVRPHRRQPTRLPRPWDSPGKNAGVGCHFLLQCLKVKSERKSVSRVWLFTTPWTAAYQAPPPMGFSRQEYWSGVPLPSQTLVILYLHWKILTFRLFFTHWIFLNSGLHELLRYASGFWASFNFLDSWLDAFSFMSIYRSIEYGQQKSV